MKQSKTINGVSAEKRSTRAKLALALSFVFFLTACAPASTSGDAQIVHSEPEGQESGDEASSSARENESTAEDTEDRSSSDDQGSDRTAKSPKASSSDGILELADTELERIPDRILKRFKEDGWKLCITDRDINEDYFDGQYETVSAVTLYEDKTILVKNDIAAVTNSVIHEVGHYVDNCLGFPSSSEEFIEIYRKNANIFRQAFDSTCITDQKEFYAEVFWQYIINPAKLQLECPDAYTYMKQTIKDFH